MTTYNIEVPVTLVFQPDVILLKVGEQTFNLAALDSLDEFRVLLFGLAQGAIQSIAGDAASKITGTVPSVEGAADKLAEAFRRQAERSKQHLAEAQETYEAAVANLNR